MPENRTSGENQPARQNVLPRLLLHTPPDVDLPPPPADKDNIAGLNALAEDQLLPNWRPVKTENGIASEIGDLMSRATIHWLPPDVVASSPRGAMHRGRGLMPQAYHH
jgi:hypothetical protein